MAYDLSRLYIKFQDAPPGTPLVEHFAELGAYPEFRDVPDNIIKIAILTGDIESPFVLIKDRETMMKTIFEFLYIDVSIQENREILEKAIIYKEEKINVCWLKYLEILNETEFTDWQIAKKDYNFFLMKSKEEMADGENEDRYLDRRNKIRKTLKELGEEVRSIEAKIFPDSKAAREAAIIEQKKKITLYAEKYASDYSYM